MRFRSCMAICFEKRIVCGLAAAESLLSPQNDNINIIDERHDKCNDKNSALSQVHDRTSNPKIQELIMDLGETPVTQSPACEAAVPNGNPDFYSAVDEETLPYVDCDDGTTASDQETLTTKVKSHHDFEVDPQTCWPCVGCQDDDVPTTMRWCSVM